MEHTIGFNPMFHNSEFIRDEILKNTNLVQNANTIKKVYYYGASVSSPDRREIVRKALADVFKSAELYTDHDLIAAARSTCGETPGIACILGTGSNSCFYDGKNIADGVPALGYILGDEGGGAWFGRELLRLYLYNLLSDEIKEDLKGMGAEKEEIFRRIYRSPGPNVYLASFMPLIGKHRADATIKNMLHHGFLEFCKFHVCTFENYKNYSVHFVGSVAMYFKEELFKVCSELNIATGIITNEPVQELFTYHLKNA